MKNPIPDETIQTFARTIHQESLRYGFEQLDVVRLVNCILDMAVDEQAAPDENAADPEETETSYSTDSFPLKSKRLQIRRGESARDKPVISEWLSDEYGKHFLLSCATAQHVDVDSLFDSPLNELGIIEYEGKPIGAVAFLDIDHHQRRAELRKLIGIREARGKGLAEEATKLWIWYGGQQLGLDKIYVSTLQMHLRNIQLNESIGFRIEGVLREEVLIGDRRHDVLRMGLCFSEFADRY